MSSSRVFHLALAEEWGTDPGQDYEQSSLGLTLAEQGFIHCSFAHQIQRVADAMFRGRNDVVLLEIDTARLQAPLRIEPNPGDREGFPHLHGPLNRDAVRKVTPLRLSSGGRLEVPASVRPAEPMGWMSYDSVATMYERVAVPGFAPMASDLVAALGLSAGARVLDVGSGTGITAELAHGVVGRDGVVVGLDPSWEMLWVGSLRRALVSVAGMAPGLPFATASFDAVAANLVLSHVPDLVGGVVDMVRLLVPGGRFGATAWAPDPHHPDDQGSDAYRIFTAVGEEYGLTRRPRETAVPWEEILRDRTEFESLLAGTGLHDVEVRAHTYLRVMSVGEYLSGWGTLWRYLRSELGEQALDAFSARATDRLQERFGPTMVSVQDIWIATGTTA